MLSFYDAAILKQGHHGQFLAGKSTTVVATSAACCSAKFKQGLGLGGLASRGGPGKYE